MLEQYFQKLLHGAHKLFLNDEILSNYVMILDIFENLHEFSHVG